MSDKQRDPNTSNVTLPLSEETLEARVFETEIGKVRIHKRIETDRLEQDVELSHDDVVVERAERNEVVKERREPWLEGEVLIIPVYEEVLVSEKRLMLREVIRVARGRQSERVNVGGEVRREVVDIERIDE
jgi:stress response protein YsnF